MVDYGPYRIKLDRDWSLEDLYNFPRAFEQVYFFFSSIDENLEEPDREKISLAYHAFPWQGGYSAVNFFNQLKYATRPSRRPKIIAIQKSSPGFLDLSLYIATAISIAKTVNQVLKTIDFANTTYNNIYKGMQERKLLRLSVRNEELKLSQAELKFVIDCSDSMAKLLGRSSAAEITKLTGDPYLTVKLLMAVYRRVRILSDYQNKGKADLTEEPDLSLLFPPKKRVRPTASKNTVRKKKSDL